MVKKPQIDSILEKVRRWAERSWADALISWKERPPQDFAYRKYVVEPAVSKIIRQLDLNKSSSIAEIGCGDGAHTLFWREQLDSLGLKDVTILGVDLLESLIDKAKRKIIGYRNIYFEVCDVSSEDVIKLIMDRIGTPHVIIAMFLLQDVPDLEGVLKTVITSLKKNGHFIAVFVHPDFAMHLLKIGQVKVTSADKDIPDEYITPTGIVQWRFRGYYPIAQEDKPPFYVPYFHRSLKDYHEAFKKTGLTVLESIPLMPDKGRIATLEKEKVLPFVQIEWNIYWPMIVKEPSSMLIHAVKQDII